MKKFLLGTLGLAAMAAPALAADLPAAYKAPSVVTPVYDWTINDKIFDTYLANGIKPYVQIGFMPEALYSQCKNCREHNRHKKSNADQRVHRDDPFTEYSN